MATDSFDYASSGTLPTVSSNKWTNMGSSSLYSSGSAGNPAYAAYSNASGAFRGSYCTIAGGSADQYSQCKVVKVPSTTSTYAGPMVRYSVTAAYWFCYRGNGTLYLTRTNGSGSIQAYIKNTSYTMNVNDVMKLTVSGSSLKCYINGSEITDLAATDTNVADGEPGIGITNLSAANEAAVDDWEGGDLPAESSIAPLAAYYARMRA